MEELFDNLLNLLLIVVAIIVGVLILIMTLLYFFQNKILYLPVLQGLPKSPKQNPDGIRNPLDCGLEYEDVYIMTKDQIKLHGWFCKQKQSTQVPTMLFFHENAGSINQQLRFLPNYFCLDIGTRIHYLQYYFQKVKCNVMLIAYRGYSDSEGEPNEQGIQLDSIAIISHLLKRNDIDQTRVYIHGRSLGGAVTVYAMSQFDFHIAGIILENTFTSLADMIDVIFSKLAFLKSLIQKNFWPSINRIQKIKVPILFIISKKDELVPYQQMERLMKKAEGSSLIQKHIVENGQHNNSWYVDVDGYFKAIREFIAKVETNQKTKVN